MKKIVRTAAALMLAGTLTACGTQSGQTTPPEAHGGAQAALYAVAAGSADALLLSCGGQTALIDAGYGRSMGAIRYGMEQLGADKLDYVILTHVDEDHADGLAWLAESDVAVGQWCASAKYAGVKEKKHPAVKAAGRRGESVRFLAQGDVLPLGGASLEVLAPASGGEPADDDDNNSLVMMFRSGAGRILLTGDMEDEEEAWLLDSGADLACDVLKAANHGDDDTGSVEFIRHASPKLVVIPCSSAEKEGTPDPALLRRLAAIGAEVYETQKTDGGVLVRLSEAGVSAGYVPLPKPAEDLGIVSVSPDDDTVALVNNGGTDASLRGWYLYSERGGELFVFPDDAVIRAGETLVVGTNTTGSPCDLLWDDEKVISKKKPDAVTLYSPDGYAACRADNGIKE